MTNRFNDSRQRIPIPFDQSKLFRQFHIRPSPFVIAVSMFDDLFTGFSGPGLQSASAGWQGVTPTLDVTETEKELVVAAELPGLDDRDFEVTLAGDVLTIKGEKKSEHEEKNGDAHYMERRFGSFSRAVRLPFEVKDEKVDAKYDKGILTIRVPKPAEAQRAVRRIEVKAH